MLKNSFPLVSALCILFINAALVAAKTDEGNSPAIHFRDLVGVNQGEPGHSALWEFSIGFSRKDIPWPHVQPRQDRWEQKVLRNWAERFARRHQEQNVGVLPMLGYGASWATDTSGHQFHFEGVDYTIKPSEDGKHLIFKGVNQEGAVVRDLKRNINHTHLPVKQKHVSAWESFVGLAVRLLRQEPYNVEYYQPWNEAHPMSGFYDGDMDIYFERVHLPAARIIREEGGKVVYGGWPACGSMHEFLRLLDRHEAWETLDVISIHYRRLEEMEKLRRAAAERGRADIGIWQTEAGFTDDPGYISNFYPRFAYWALKHNNGDSERFKVFYFAHWSPNDAAAYGHGKTLLSGKKLSPHGKSLQTLGKLLGGSSLERYAHASSNRGLEFNLNEKNSGMEAFLVGSRIVIAIHLGIDEAAKEKPFLVYLPQVRVEDVESAKRVTTYNERTKLTAAGNPDGEGVIIEASTELPGEYARNREWNTNFPRVFFIEVELSTD